MVYNSGQNKMSYLPLPEETVQRSYAERTRKVSAKKRAMQIEDLNKIVYIDDPQISPDGRRIVFVQVVPDTLGKGYKRYLWMVYADGSQPPMQITRGGKDTQPAWSPDGKYLAFSSTRGDSPAQIYILPITDPGEARQISKSVHGASSPAWSPDGKSIAYLARMSAEDRAKEDRGEEVTPPADSLEAKHRKERQAEADQRFFDPLRVTRIPYREGTSFLSDRYQQIYVQPVDETDSTSARRLTNLDTDYHELCFSQDGRTLYSLRTRDLSTDEPNRFLNIFAINIADAHETQLVDNEHYLFDLQLSPDGQSLSCQRGVTEDLMHLFKLSVVPLNGRPVRTLNEALDRTVEFSGWTGDGQLVTGVVTHGRVELHRCNIENGSYSPILNEDQLIYHMATHPEGGIAYVSCKTMHPDELWYMAPGATEARQLTHMNQALVDEVEVLPTHEIWFDSPSGVKVQGWYILPANYEEGKKYPLALNIHGGPRVMWAPSARAMWHEWQVHAADGYVVFYCNPRGGDGYGEAFRRALYRNWGPVAMADIMAGVDLMIARGFVDQDRLAITGGSYGGYMTAWIVGHSTRFKAAVAQRGVYNLSSFYGTSDIPSLIKNDFGVTPWEDQTLLWQHSPLAYAQAIDTPLLIIHSEQDYRVPIEQAEQLFAFIRRRGGEVELLRFPKEGHELSRSGEPGHRIHRLEAMRDWFNRFCMAKDAE